MIAVVVPAYKEAQNITPLTERLFAALKNCCLIIVDDNSCDGSKEIVDKLSKKYPIEILVRTKERGLSSAVLHGFNYAAKKPLVETLVCMDADLQHPPESLPDMIAALSKEKFAIGTRYAGNNSIDKNWPLYRRVISGTARLMARPLTPLSDPMTGFFAIEKNLYLKSAHLANPIGFKICLELYVKCNVKSHAEVPIVFGVRAAGESKLSGKVIINYVKHLIELYWHSMPLQLVAMFLVALFAIYLVLSTLAGI
jgi:dolichol-phosphate mannosyltransferase